MEPELPDPTPSLTPSGTQPQIAELAAEWRASLAGLRDAAAGAADELTSLREGVGVAISRLRQADLWESDPEGVDRMLSSLADRLEQVQVRLEARAAQVDQAQRRAAEAAASSIRRLGVELQRLTGAPRGEGTGLLADRLADVEGRLTETIQRATRELHQHVSRGLADSSGGWDVVLDGLAEVRKSVDQLRDAAPTTAEVAAMAPHLVEGLQEQLVETLTDRISSAEAGIEERLGSVEEAVRSLPPRVEPAQGGRARRTDAERQLAATTTALRKEIEAFRKRIEGWGKPRTAPRLAEEVERLEGHVEDLGRAVEEQLAAKVARRVQASIDRRLRTLIGELPEQLRDTIGEAVHEAAAASVAEVAREAAASAVRTAAEEAVREALRQPAEPAEGSPEAEPPGSDPGRRRLRFRR
ncbi:MAG TPA: hypothetical protein VHL78_02610 [Actinomycetota bacterium]|nr:hypothetical protein [Actinomycetota bacterium]